MSTFLIISITLVLSFLICIVIFLYFAWSAKRTLLKGQTSWSAKKIPIKRTELKLKKTISNTLLERISAQTSDYLSSDQDLNE